MLREAAPPREATSTGHLPVPRSFPQGAGETGMLVEGAGLHVLGLGLVRLGVGVCIKIISCLYDEDVRRRQFLPVTDVRLYMIGYF